MKSNILLSLIIFSSAVFAQDIVKEQSKETKFLDVQVDNPVLQNEIDALKNAFLLDLEAFKVKHKKEKKELRGSYKDQLKALRKKYKDTKKRDKPKKQKVKSSGD